MLRDFEGRRLLVTGGAAGLGRAMVEEFAARGAEVMIADIDERAAAEAAEAIGVRSIVCDVAVAEQCKAAMDATVAAFGGLDGLINNAGITGELKTIAEQDGEAFSRCIDVNLKGVFFCTKYAIPALVESRGAIVNIASAAGMAGAPLMAGYSATKGAVIRLTQVSALELREHDVRVNAVCPGITDTGMGVTSQGDVADISGIDFTGFVEARQGGRTPGGREVAKLVAYLASPDAEGITGSHHLIDAGLMASWA